MTDTTTAARPERRKYDLIADSKITAFGVDLFRVRALISFGDVAAGDLGGYVQSEKSLDQDGDAWVYGDAQVYGDAIMQIGPIGSRSATLTATLSAGGSVQVVTGCFLGSLDEFRTAVETTHGDSQHGRDYRAAITLIESRAASWSLPEAVFAAVPIKGEQA